MVELTEDITQLMDIEAIKKLPFQKKRAIIDFIEETIGEGDYNEGIPEDYDEEETEEELRILDERIEHHRLNPHKAVSLEDLQKEFLTDGRG